MHIRLRVLPLLALLAIAGAAGAETLLIERVREEPAMALPARGMSMEQVQARYGMPQDRMDPRGGQKRQWPTINRWRYANFIVYFEKNKVVDAVAVQADPTETGPKPPIR